LCCAIGRPPNPGGRLSAFAGIGAELVNSGWLARAKRGRGTRWKEHTTTYWRSDACS
jgi:hypothetical protein